MVSVFLDEYVQAMLNLQRQKEKLKCMEVFSFPELSKLSKKHPAYKIKNRLSTEGSHIFDTVNPVTLEPITLEYISLSMRYPASDRIIIILVYQKVSETYMTAVTSEVYNKLYQKAKNHYESIVPFDGALSASV